jgi:NAD(P)-dependent dehydrogenase (short-subunit alcohol dehydrogenase family)/catechol 2,3-dioxygenase-like lactoylglutathione lyase family enzyme
MTAQDAPRTALITGASRGLGLALARALADRGWTLLLDARGADALEAARRELAARTTVVALAGDVADPAHRQALARAAAVLGGLHALVNNASILGPSPQPTLLDYPLDVLEQVYRVNTLAPLALLQALRDQLGSGARVLNITSDAGIQPYEGWGGYGSSKAALEQLSNILAAECPDWRVYWVDPGDMRTEMHQQAFPGEDISDRPPPEESVPGLLALLEGDLPSGRYEARRLTSSLSDAVAEPADAAGVDELSVVLTVADFDHALAFYRDGLGLSVVKEWHGDDGRGAILAAGRGTVELQDHADAETTDRVEIGMRVEDPVRLAFGLTGGQRVEERAANLQARGIEALGAAKDTPWGRRTQRLRTPDGVQVTLFERAPEKE